MKSITVIIPNYNGIHYLKGCLASLRKQTYQDFDTVLIDNGSNDGSARFVRENFPEVKVRTFSRNTGFCHAVNAGIRISHSPYIILLNNDIICSRSLIEELYKAIIRERRAFSCCAKLLRMGDRSLIDDAGDFYCALGWAYARGTGAKKTRFCTEGRVFACCAAAAIYRRDIFDEIGIFEESFFAYLEDIDIGYRSKIYGYVNIFCPRATALHAGSATSGSRHNAFKVKYASRNSIYLIRRNMPSWQVALNFPPLIVGFLIKACYFAIKGLGKEYIGGILYGMKTRGRFCRAPKGHFLSYLSIQLQLWLNCVGVIDMLTEYRSGR